MPDYPGCQDPSGAHSIEQEEAQLIVNAQLRKINLAGMDPR